MSFIDIDATHKKCMNCGMIVDINEFAGHICSKDQNFDRPDWDSLDYEPEYKITQITELQEIIILLKEIKELLREISTLD